MTAVVFILGAIAGMSLVLVWTSLASRKHQHVWGPWALQHHGLYVSSTQSRQCQVSSCGWTEQRSL